MDKIEELMEEYYENPFNDKKKAEIIALFTTMEKEIERLNCEDCAGFGYVVSEMDGGDDTCIECNGTGKSKEKGQ